jgi:hypothetical protein
MINMVEVFKTNVYGARQSKVLLAKLHEHFPTCKINIDLEDCDKVLRFEGETFCANRVMELLKLNGYKCEILTY